MTDQHPLTDRICFNILSNKYDVSARDWHKYQNTVDLMRAAADWQLEQVVEFISKQDTVYYDDPAPLANYIKQAMRPTTETP